MAVLESMLRPCQEAATGHCTYGRRKSLLPRESLHRQLRISDKTTARSHMKRLQELQVPVEFDVSSNGMPCAAHFVSAVHDDQQWRCLQASVHSFRRAMVRGISVGILVDDSRAILGEVCLNSELTYLVVHMSKEQRPVPLKSITCVCAAKEAVAVENSVLDDRCVTIVIDHTSFLTLVFNSTRTSEYFKTCLKVILLANGTECTPD